MLPRTIFQHWAFLQNLSSLASDYYQDFIGIAGTWPQDSMTSGHHCAHQAASAFLLQAVVVQAGLHKGLAFPLAS